MYETIVGSIYDAVCNDDSTQEIESKIEEAWKIYENSPTQDNALSVSSMYEFRGFYLGFEAAMNLLLHK